MQEQDYLNEIAELKAKLDAAERKLKSASFQSRDPKHKPKSGTLGAVLRGVRQEKGLNLGEVAASAKVTRSTIWLLETNRNAGGVNTLTLGKIASALGVKLSDIFLQLEKEQEELSAKTETSCNS